jgi:hypothetical protein
MSGEERYICTVPSLEEAIRARRQYADILVSNDIKGWLVHMRKPMKGQRGWRIVLVRADPARPGRAVARLLIVIGALLTGAMTVLLASRHDWTVLEALLAADAVTLITTAIALDARKRGKS